MHNLNMQPTTVNIHSLRPHPSNPNKGRVEVIAQSIEASGWFGRVLVQHSTGHILAGEHRWRAAIEQGATEIDIQPVDCDDATARKILLVDNRSAELAARDPEALAALLAELNHDGDLVGTGYTDGDLNALLSSLDPSAIDEADRTGAQEYSEEGFESFEHKCPRCGFEFDEGAP